MTTDFETRLAALNGVSREEEGMSAKLYNIHQAKSYKPRVIYDCLGKVSLNQGQLEMICIEIEKGMLGADSARDAQIFADIGDLLIEFCKPEGSK